MRGRLDKGVLILGVVATITVIRAAVAVAAPEPPLTKPATAITTNSAKLNGVLNPHAGGTAGYFFQYGREGACEGIATEPMAEDTGEAISVTTVLTGLIPNTAYTFCVVATNAATETATGAPETFTTLPVVPLIEQESAAAITRTSAVLSAQVNPELQPTFCVNFQYVDDASFNGSEFAGAAEASCKPEFLGEGVIGEASASVAGLSPNTIYHFRVSTENGSGTSQGPDSTFVTLPVPPMVETAGASAVTASSATVAGVVNPGSDGPNSDTTYLFQYGLTAGYGLETGLQDAGEGNLARSVAAQLSSLRPGASYHYRLVASDANDAEAPQTVYGKDEVFNTLATPPALGAVSVSDVGQSTATVDARLESKGLATRYELQLGQTQGVLQGIVFGSTASAQSLSSQSLSLMVSELSPGTVYFYKLVAENTNGVTESGEGTFTTASAAPTVGAVEQPETPSQLLTPAIRFPGEAVPAEKAPSGPMTNRQKLAKALKACRKRPKKRRQPCERTAHRRYTAKVRA